MFEKKGQGTDVITSAPRMRNPSVANSKSPEIDRRLVGGLEGNRSQLKAGS
jgi:hypothetical protein